MTTCQALLSDYLSGACSTDNLLLEKKKSLPGRLLFVKGTNGRQIFAIFHFYCIHFSFLKLLKSGCTCQTGVTFWKNEKYWKSYTKYFSIITIISLTEFLFKMALTVCENVFNGFYPKIL